MTLADELQAQRSASSKNAPELVALIDRVLDRLREQRTGGDAPRIGEPAPDFELPDASGRLVRLSRTLRDGPVVLTFYRGGWCPYCNLQLRAYQQALPRILQLGARLVAVSPQTPDASLTVGERNALTFDVLSDAGSAVARRYGLAFEFPDDLRAAYLARNISLPAYNGTDDWTLPVPATFIVARDGRVALCHLDVDYRVRLEPATIIATLESIAD